MEMLKHLSKRERALFIVAAACIVLAIVYRVVMIPVRDHSREMDTRIQSLSRELAILQRMASERGEVAAEYRRMATMLPPGASEREEISSMLAQLEQIASRHAVSLLDVKPRKTKEEEWAKTYSVELEIEGDARQLVKFLHELNTVPGAIRVDDLQIRRKDKSQEILRVSLLASKLTFKADLSAAGR